MGKHKPTLSEIAQELRDAPTPKRDGPNAARPGAHNGAGEFFDPAGLLLVVSKDSIAPDEALELARAGALIAFEGCGCGGSASCPIAWFSPSEVKALVEAGTPSVAKRHASWSWIDVWTSGDSVVVFAHGNVRWADLMA